MFRACYPHFAILAKVGAPHKENLRYGVKMDSEIESRCVVPTCMDFIIALVEIWHMIYITYSIDLYLYMAKLRKISP